MDENALIRAMTSKGHTESTARGAIAGRGYADLAREYLGSSGAPSAPGGGNTDVLSQARQLLGFNQEANKPVIDSLQSQVGELGNIYAGQRQRLQSGIAPMRERYNQILDEMKGNVGKDLSREYGRRGIPLSSGMYESDLTSKINPLVRDIGLAQEEGARSIEDLIAGLLDKETSGKRDIYNAIAQLQAGQPSSAISNALTLSSQRASEDTAVADRTWKEKVYKETELPESQATVAKSRNALASGGAIDFNTEYNSWLKSQQTSGSELKGPFAPGMSTYGPQVSTPAPTPVRRDYTRSYYGMG